MSGLDTKAELKGARTSESVALEATRELRRACEKHPTWPTRFISVPLEMVRGHLAKVRRINDGKDAGNQPTACFIINEELSEMQEAVLSGDLDAARQECIQAMAMLLRLYVHLPHYCAVARGETNAESEVSE
jgi:hypothetical protein